MSYSQPVLDFLLLSKTLLITIFFLLADKAHLPVSLNRPPLEPCSQVPSALKYYDEMVPVPAFAHHHLLDIWTVGSGLESSSLVHERFNNSKIKM